MINTKIAISAATAVMLSTAVDAATITATNLGDGAAAYAQVDTGNGTALDANTSLDAAVRTGSAATYRSPYDFSGSAGVTGFEGLSYFAVGPTNTPSPATLSFAAGYTATTLSFLWGSIDGYNSVDFVLGGSVIGSISNTDISPSSSESAGVGASYVRITSDMAFDSVVFRSTSEAFEFANVTTDLSPIPLPASSLLLLAGLAGFGAVARRKKSAA